MDESLEKGLLDMEARDQALRNELANTGQLTDAYHPKLEELHRANASRLRQIIAVFGWPGWSLVGEKGANAAWRIALHSISEPGFMRQCRDLINAATQNNDAPRWQFAIMDDRIRVLEGQRQRYGTQLKLGVNGFEPQPLEDESRVNSMRMQAGLPPLAKVLAQANANSQASGTKSPPPNQSAIDQAELEWRRQVGWIR